MSEPGQDLPAVRVSGDDGRPRVAACQGGPAQVEPQPALLLRRPVAADTAGRKEWAHVASEVGSWWGRCGAEWAGREERGEREKEREAHLKWLHESYIPRMLKKPGFLHAAQ